MSIKQTPAKAPRASRSTPAKAGHNNPPRFKPEAQEMVFAYGKSLGQQVAATKAQGEARHSAEQMLLALLVDASVRNYAEPAKAKGGASVKVSIAQYKAIPAEVPASAFWDAICRVFAIPTESRATFRSQVQRVMPVALRLAEEKCAVKLEGRQTRILAPTRKASKAAKIVADLGPVPFSKIEKVMLDKPVQPGRGARQGTDKAKSMNVDGAAALLARFAMEKDVAPAGALLANIRTIVKRFGPLVTD